jgi:hypothetical protein
LKPSCLSLLSAAQYERSIDNWAEGVAHKVEFLSNIYKKKKKITALMEFMFFWEKPHNKMIRKIHYRWQ